MILLSSVMSHGADDQHLVWCPGCNQLHGFHVDSPSRHNGSHWSWNGDVDKPTFTPSLLVNKDTPHNRCHSFLTAGVWNFLSDCWHTLAGKQVRMVDLPEWLTEDLGPIPISHHGVIK